MNDPTATPLPLSPPPALPVPLAMAAAAAHPAIAAFLDHLRQAGRTGSARAYDLYLRPFARWLAAQGLDLLTATPADLIAYQGAVADARHHRTGAPLAGTTRVTRSIAVMVLYRWLYRRGIILVNPAARLDRPPSPRRLTVAKDHLSQQEVAALLQTLADQVTALPAGSIPWARALRDLALIATALATGRRCQGLITLRVADLDLERGELRVAWEKGRTGRVLPVAAWCVGVLRRYLAEARAIVLGPHRTSDALFPSRKAARICGRTLADRLDVVVAATVRAHPDLTDLPHKRITTHSLRVSFATLLFAGGCNIRSLNELMLHVNLSTTAQYTPIPLEDMRRVLLTAHPRA